MLLFHNQMKSRIKIFFLLSIAVVLQGCGNSYEKLSSAYDYYEAKELDKTLIELSRNKTSARKNGLFYKEISLFEGKVYYEMDSLDKAEQSFKAVLAGTSKAIKFTRSLKKKISRYDPYSKLYYDANMSLAKVYNAKGQYHESLSFLDKAENGLYFFGCGIGWMEEQFLHDSLFVRNQLELGDIDRILERLEGNIFNLSRSKNYGDVDEIANLIKEHYSPDEIASILDEVVSSIEKRETSIEGIIEKEYFSNWFGKEVRILGLNIYNYLDEYYYDYEIKIDSITGIPFSIPKSEQQLIEIVQTTIMGSEIYLALRG